MKANVILRSLLAATLLSVATTSVLADSSTTIYTPKGSAVSATKVTSELTPAQVTAGNQYVATTYPQAVRETNATKLYNCHSYAWYSQSTSNNIWINSPGDDKYWLDKSYLLISTVNGGLSIPTTVANGSKVSYKLADHSAIKVSSTQYRSKWGSLPRMLHKPGYCPYACENCSFTVSYYKVNPS
jgi:hypothetical protein